MKKSKFLTGLSAAFISAMALMSCSSLIKAKDGVILTIDGVPYTAEDLFNDQKTPAAAEAKFNAVYKVAVRAYFTKDPGKQEMTEITNNTKIKINEQKATAQSNADKNGTSYNEEWQKILDANGVDDEAGLYDKFEYDLQKEKFENNFYDQHYDQLRSGKEFPGLEGKGIKFTNYLVGKQPYHIKHILVKIDGAKGTDVTNTEISAEDARNIGTLIMSLAKGVTFESLAHSTYNEDETARDNNGSLGVMSRDTSFVNDFKLGIYMYESFYGSSTKTNSLEPTTPYQAIDAKMSLKLDKETDGGAGQAANEISTLIDPSTTAETGGTGIGIGQIPYEAAERLYQYADMDFTNDTIKQRFKRDGLAESDVSAKYLPRNVIFNKYFNKHNIMVITPRKLHDYTTGGGNISNWVSIDDETKGKVRSGNYDKYLGAVDNSTGGYTSLDGFNRATKKNNDKLDVTLPQEGGASTSEDVLRDENGRVILVFRSGTGDSSNDAYQGIHFVVIERSPFIGLEYDKGNPGDTDAKTTSLDEYYTQYYPEQSTGDVTKHHPTYNDYDPSSKNNDWKHTFVNYFSGKTSTELKERADTVKSELKKCDPKLDTYLYQNLIVTGGITFSEKAEALGIKDSIDKWINISRNSYDVEQKRTWDETWEDYCWSLKNQNELRMEYPDVESGTPTRIYSKLIPEACVYSFLDDSYNTYGDQPEEKFTLKDLFGEGGVFHD